MQQHGIKRHTLWIGFAAALVPLALLLVLQYRWLVKLDHTSAQAHEATLANYLEAVVTEVETTYQGKAERALNLPASIFTPERLEKAAHHFKKKRVDGARRFFVLLPPQAEGQHTQLRYYDPATVSLVEPEWSPEARAIWVAAAPYLTLGKKGGTIETIAATADERDPENRVLLAPVTDDASRLVGVAGMILDDEYLKRQLPGMVTRSLPRFFALDRELEPVVWVRDQNRRAVFSTAEPGCALSEYPPEVKKAFSYVFTDWEVGLSSRHATPGQVARRNFLVNIAPLRRPLRRADRRHPALPAHRRARDEAVADEERLRLQRLARAAHPARLDPRLRRVPAPGPRRQPREDPRVRRLHRDREPAPHPADQQPPRLREHRVRAQELPLRARRPAKRSSPRP